MFRACALATLVASAAAVTPAGVYATVSNTFIVEEIANILVGEVNNLNNNNNLPDQSGSIDHYDWSTDSMVFVTSAGHPSVSFTGASADGFTMNLVVGVSFIVTGNWHGRMHIWPHAHISGSFTIMTSTPTEITAPVTISTPGGGSATSITATAGTATAQWGAWSVSCSCQDSVCPLSMHDLANDISGIVPGQFMSAVQTAFEAAVANYRGPYAVSFPVADIGASSLNGYFAPSAGQPVGTFWTIPLAGTFAFGTNPPSALSPPLSPPGQAVSPNDGATAGLSLAPGAIRSAILAAATGGAFSESLTAAGLAALCGSFCPFKLNTGDTTIQDIAPGFKSITPAQDLTIVTTFGSVGTPSTAAAASGASITVPLTITMAWNLASGANAFTASVSINVLADVSASTSGNTAVTLSFTPDMKTSVSSTTISVTDTNVGAVSTTALMNIFTLGAAFVPAKPVSHTVTLPSGYTVSGGAVSAVSPFILTSFAIGSAAPNTGVACPSEPTGYCPVKTGCCPSGCCPFGAGSVCCSNGCCPSGCSCGGDGGCSCGNVIVNGTAVRAMKGLGH